MTILIAKANKDIFTEFDSKINFTESTKNTCTFRMTEKKFIKLRNYIREKGFNPFSLMYWY